MHATWSLLSLTYLLSAASTSAPAIYQLPVKHLLSGQSWFCCLRCHLLFQKSDWSLATHLLFTAMIDGTFYRHSYLAMLSQPLQFTVIMLHNNFFYNTVYSTGYSSR